MIADVVEHQRGRDEESAVGGRDEEIVVSHADASVCDVQAQDLTRGIAEAAVVPPEEERRLPRVLGELDQATEILRCDLSLRVGVTALEPTDRAQTRLVGDAKVRASREILEPGHSGTLR